MASAVWPVSGEEIAGETRGDLGVKVFDEGAESLGVWMAEFANALLVLCNYAHCVGLDLRSVNILLLHRILRTNFEVGLGESRSRVSDDVNSECINSNQRCMGRIEHTGGIILVDIV